MPELVGDELVARVDPGRETHEGETVLIAKKVTFESAKPRAAHIAGVAEALKEAARWIGASEVLINEVKPASVKSQLRTLVN